MSVRLRLSPVSNREAWIDRVQITDENGKPFDLLNAQARMSLNYQPNNSSVFTAQQGDGQLFAKDNGILEWEFDVSRMRTLCPGIYNVGMVANIEGIARQIFTGTIEVEKGNVP
ncbi:hypothetical protein WJT86_10140 [Microvirga sp. W0021]|uniref:Uncharacterized protein n=1 Tax=Hohaiivirga grylli TaxID=3133970 RepID=A0ABV0BPE4_9HYPH